MLVALVLTLLSQTEAPAPPPPPSVELEIERARLLISDLYEEQALELLGALLSDASLAPPLRARALIYSGIAQLNLNHDEPGRRAFREALALDIGSTLPEWVSRRVRVVFEAELVQVLRPKPIVEAPTPVVTVTPVIEPVIVPAEPVRKPWVAAALAGGMLTSATFSVLGFARFSAQYSHAQHARVALDAQNLDASSRVWLAVGEIATAAAFACAAGILWWWLRPLPN